MKQHIAGHHHISMMTKNEQKNNHFYQHVLGLRRVKVTVNQDDPSMYHIFYGDKKGTSGTVLSFFVMSNLGQTHRGTNAITRIGLVVPNQDSLSFWVKRLEQHGVQHQGITMYANRQTLHFEDPDGLRLFLIAGGGHTPPAWEPWKKSSVPVHHQIQGMGTIEMKVRRLQKLAKTLTELFGYTEPHYHENEAIFQSASGDIFGEIIVIEEDGPRERPGRGSIHHLAIRAEDETELIYWDEQIKKKGFSSTGIIDRFYFKSLYFRESNGILIEIATDGPGFTVDEAVDSLGEKTVVPPFLADKRYNRATIFCKCQGFLE